MKIAVFIAVTLVLGTVASVVAAKVGNLTWPWLIALVVGACIVAAPLSAVLLDEDEDSGGPNTPSSLPTTSTIEPPASTSQSTTRTSIRDTRVILADDFSEASLGGWPTEIEGMKVARYSSGEYVVRAPSSGWTNLFPQGGGSRLSQVSVEVDGRRVTNTLAKFGVVCRHGGPDRPFYAAWIDGAGFFQVFQATPEVPVGNLVMGRDAIAVAEAGQSLRVKLECFGGEGSLAVLKLSVNDRLVAEATDPTGLPAGAAGLITGGSGMAGAEIAFDNFTAIRSAG